MELMKAKPGQQSLGLRLIRAIMKAGRLSFMNREGTLKAVNDLVFKMEGGCSCWNKSRLAAIVVRRQHK